MQLVTSTFFPEHGRPLNWGLGQSHDRVLHKHWPPSTDWPAWWQGCQLDHGHQAPSTRSTEMTRISCDMFTLSASAKTFSIGNDTDDTISASYDLNKGPATSSAYLTKRKGQCKFLHPGFQMSLPLFPVFSLKRSSSTVGPTCKLTFCCRWLFIHIDTFQSFLIFLLSSQTQEHRITCNSVCSIVNIINDN